MSKHNGNGREICYSENCTRPATRTCSICGKRVCAGHRCRNTVHCGTYVPPGWVGYKNRGKSISDEQIANHERNRLFRLRMHRQHSD